MAAAERLSPLASLLTSRRANVNRGRYSIYLCGYACGRASDCVAESKHMTTPTVSPKNRLKNPAMTIPEAMAPLKALGQLLGQLQGESGRALSLALLRTAQLNGCALCIEGSCTMLRGFGEAEERIFAVPAWRESTRFTAPERAALALAEAMTRLSDRSDPVPDVVWDEAARQFSERELALLVLGVATQNLYNRINVTTRQVGAEWDADAAKEWAAKNKR
jgi:AhpD family alkylhydroperoxidase